MIKLATFLVVTVAGSAIWWFKRREARLRLDEIDAGLRCIGCDGRDMERREDHVRCANCGHVSALATLRAAKVSEAEIALLTKPDDPRR